MNRDTSSAQPNTNKVPHRVPKPVRQSFRCILQFVSPSHKVHNLVAPYQISKCPLSLALCSAHHPQACTPIAAMYQSTT